MKKVNKNNRQYRPDTILVHEGTSRSQFGETSEAIFLTQGFVYDSPEIAEKRFKNELPGFVYSRYGNPTVAMFEQRMAALEGAEAARATSSGMAAATLCLLSQVKAGDHVVSADALFGSNLYLIQELLPRFGVETSVVKGTDLNAFKSAMRPNTKLVFIETPTNPTLEVLDIQAISDIAHNHGALMVVDNVFASPIFQKPLTLGADLVFYSATKHIDGSGRCLAGVVLGREELMTKDVQDVFRHTGPALSPFNAWVVLKGLETLSLRVGRQTDTAEKLVDMLADHHKIERVFYPHHKSHPQYELAKRQMSRGSTMLSFEVKGGKEAAFKFCSALSVISISNNLGDAKSLITHPATTTHQRIGEEMRHRLGIHDNLLRLSVGLEDVEDLKEEIEFALSQI